MVSKQGHGEERNFDRGGGKTFGGGGGVGHAEDVGWIAACVGEDGGEVGEADNCTST